jgi:hypothetical protein
MQTEFILGRLRQQALSPLYYARRAQTLASVRKVLADNKATYSLRLYAIMTLVWTAYIMDWPDLQTHLNAINALLRSIDTTQHFRVKEVEGPTLRPQWLVGMFLINEYHIPTYEEMCQTKQHFMLTLGEILRWTAEHEESSPIGDVKNHCMLQPLQDFLLEPIQAGRLGTEIPFAVAAAPFFCCFSICATVASKDMSVSEAVRFLEALQRKLVAIDNGCSKGGTALSHWLGDTRLETSILSAEEEHRHEVNICQSVMAACKMYSLLSTTTRMQVTQQLVDVIFQFTGARQVDLEVVQTIFQNCAHEADMEWVQRLS